MFVGTCIIPSTAQDTEKPLPTSRGNWLYVGGSGPGNYTRIQDAINASSDGDTVFVYDDSSPYYENIIINKSINLIGENKTNTVIVGLGNENDFSICIMADNVNVSNFNIRNPNGYIGIGIYSDFNIIKNNIISNFSYGYGEPIALEDAFNNEISNNIIENNRHNIALHFSSNNSINNNIIRNCNDFFEIGYDSNNNKIFRNLIKNCSGLYLFSDYNNIYENSIVHCQRGILLVGCSGNQILRNNFLFNPIDAFFGDSLFNHWLGNYWQRPRILPKVIFGYFTFWRGLYDFILIPVFRFDIHPALVPINIQSEGWDI